ncbi:hypothetical protein [Sphingobacterium sp. DR205]|uniref:dual OB domain-containing protein n=1 Tax=Sphingobacterium sp. DR205 TaxID=2713573 RepID=UPI0013E50514|nr:hypothetical protein [Sphingobacterium sp. DR205]QIH34112.1 hypothetical protein G6053_14995 [Sphingobacterium sp. DR205]
MEILILSKTKYGVTQACVGGICIENKQFVRLLDSQGRYQSEDTSFEIGDIWNINFTQSLHRREPHVEDVIINNQAFVKKVDTMESFIKDLNVTIWENDIMNIFDGKMLWQVNGKGYLSENTKNYPTNSVGFWISDVDLIFSNGYYIYEKNGSSKPIVYKGSEAPIHIIPKGKLIRLSLAKWWKPDGSENEERCYLQLSGWYSNKPESK